MESMSSYQRGAAKIREVYAGEVPDLPEGTNPFYDVMLRTLFAEVWTRDDVLDIRSRRLLLMGVIATLGQADVWKVQARAALKRRELTPDQLRETLIMVAPYAGFPNVAGLAAVCEQVIATWTEEGQPTVDTNLGEPGS